MVDLYILGRQKQLGKYLHQVAFGSVLHTVQDSFAGAHVSRELNAPEGSCKYTEHAQPRRIIEFHTYAAQDGGLHDEQDRREAMVKLSVADRWPDAVEATHQLAQYSGAGAKWAEVEPYMHCLFELVDDRKDASPGDLYRRK